ncbi:MAG: hypothetical protein ACO1NX_03295 [Chitinophagaceae bacterium]
MAKHLTTRYKQGMAHYQMTDEAGYRIATLLHYNGQAQNRPPARFIVVAPRVRCQQLLQQPALADDVRTCLHQTPAAPAPDPLFPQKEFRHCLVDYLV